MEREVVGTVLGEEKISTENGSFTELFCSLSQKVTIPSRLSQPQLFLEAKSLTKSWFLHPFHEYKSNIRYFLPTFTYSIYIYIYIYGLWGGDRGQAVIRNNNNSLS
jgi:hypothetical protein